MRTHHTKCSTNSRFSTLPLWPLQVATLHHTMQQLDFGLLWKRVQEWGGYLQVRPLTVL